MQLEHGLRWRDSTVQFGRPGGPPHFLQKFGVAPTVWITEDVPIAERVERLSAAEPQFVFGHVAVLRRIARALLERKAEPIAPKAVFAFGEVLDDDSRATVREGFGTDPCDVYGMSEAGFIGWQCGRKADLHVNSDCVFVEILRDGLPAAPGEIGRVVVTTLRARTLPLFRYDTGDLAAATSERCGCDLQLPTIGTVQGRACHATTAADGSLLPQRVLLNDLAGTLRMGEYRLIRLPQRRFLLRASPRAFVGAAGPDEVRRLLRGRFGEVELRIESRDSISNELKTHAFVDESATHGFAETR